MSPEELQAQKRSDIEWVMSTEQGRRFVWDLLGVCGVYRSLEGDSDSRTIQEGARRIGLHITGIITDVDEMLFFQMQLESRNRRLEEIEHERSNTSNDTITSSTEHDSEYDALTGGYDSGTIDTAFDLGSFF